MSTRALFVGVVAWTVLSIAAPVSSGAEAEALLRVQVRPGAPVHLRNRMTLNQVISAPGMTLKTEARSTTHGALTATDGTGGASLETWRFGHSAGSAASPALGKVRFDSRAGLPEEYDQRMQAAILIGTAGAELGIEIDSRGTIGTITGGDAAAKRAADVVADSHGVAGVIIAPLFTEEKLRNWISWHTQVHPFPEDAVTVGTTWKTSGIVPGTSGVTMTTHCTHEVVSIDTATVGIRTTGRIALSPQEGRTSRLTESLERHPAKTATFGGEGTLSRADGLPVRLELEMLIEADVALDADSEPGGSFVQKGTFLIERIDGEAAREAFSERDPDAAPLEPVGSPASMASLRQLFRKGSSAEEANRPEEAIEAYTGCIASAQEVLANDPESATWRKLVPTLYLRIGVLQRGLGATDDALEAFLDAERAIAELYGTDIPPDMHMTRRGTYVELAKTCYGSNDPKAGDAYANKVMGTASDDVKDIIWIRWDLAEILEATGHLQRAKDMLAGAFEDIAQLAVERDRWRFNGHTRNELGRLHLVTRDLPDAVRVLRQACEGLEREEGATGPMVLLLAEGAELMTSGREPSSEIQWLAKAYAQFEARRYGEAVASFERSFSADLVKSEHRGLHLYNAACAAALALRDAGKPDAALRTKAFSWIRRRFLALQARLVELIREDAFDTEEGKAESDRILESIEWMETGDPDLTDLRDDPGFKALFKP